MSHVLARKLGLRGVATLDPEPQLVGLGMGDTTYAEGAYSNGTNGSAVPGFGAIGELAEEMEAVDFLRHVKERLSVGCVRHSDPPKKTVRRVALITGSGGDGLERAIDAGADAFLSADLRHDRFLAARGRILLADVGHHESEFCAIELLNDVISKKIANFALHTSAGGRNPVNYLT
jgi:putative NIF3 family GTP cyclohydrolase 1 type 2